MKLTWNVFERILVIGIEQPFGQRVNVFLYLPSVSVFERGFLAFTVKTRHALFEPLKLNLIAFAFFFDRVLYSLGIVRFEFCFSRGGFVCHCRCGLAHLIAKHAVNYVIAHILCRFLGIVTVRVCVLRRCTVEHFRNALKLIGRVDNILGEISLAEHAVKLCIRAVNAHAVFVKHNTVLIAVAYAFKLRRAIILELNSLEITPEPVVRLNIVLIDYCGGVAHNVLRDILRHFRNVGVAQFFLVENMLAELAEPFGDILRLEV